MLENVVRDNYERPIISLWNYLSLINNNNYELIEIIFKFDSNIELLKLKIGKNLPIEISIPISGQIQI